MSKNEDTNYVDNIKNSDNYQFKRRRRHSSLSSLSLRLKQRRIYHTRRKLIAEFGFGFAVLGILTMVIGIEVEFANKLFDFLILFDIITSITTLCLLALIIVYYITDINLFLVDNCLNNFMLGMSLKRALFLIFELIICAIHPIDYLLLNTNGKLTQSGRIMGLLMFLRLYLMVRILVLHSWINKHSWAQGLSNFNNIHLNFQFVMKSVMNRYPVRTVAVMVAILLFWGCWAMRVCEMGVVNGVSKITDSMWLVAITFLGVGYGDIVPATHCGRVAAVLTGLFGAAITALTVAILARKLELTKSESHVHFFVISSQLNKQLKDAAANIIKCAWDLYRQKARNRSQRSGNKDLCCCTPSPSKCCQLELEVIYERRLLESICVIRNIRRSISRLREESCEMSPSAIAQNSYSNDSASIAPSTNDKDEIKDRLISIEKAIQDINMSMKKLVK